MDLNICLYCEKHLSEENVSFCSLACQTNEASKPICSEKQYPSSLTSLFINKSTNTMSPYNKFTYHRRLYYSNTSYYPLLTSSTSTSTVSSTASNNSSIGSYNNKYASFFNNIQQNVYTKYF